MFLFFFFFFFLQIYKIGTNLFRTGNAAKPKTKWWGDFINNIPGSGNWPRSRPPTTAELPLYEQGTKLKVLNSIFQNNKPTEIDTRFRYKETTKEGFNNGDGDKLFFSSEYHLNWSDKTTATVARVAAGTTQSLIFNRDDDATGISVGKSVTGPGIAVGTKVTALGEYVYDNNILVQQITLSLAATDVSGEQTLTFSTVAPYQFMTGYPSILRIHDGWDDTESTVLLTNQATGTNELSFANPHGLAPGTAVVYSDNLERTISELTDGTTYYVLQGSKSETMKLEAGLGSGAIAIAAGQGAINNKVTDSAVAEYKDWVVKIAATTIKAAIGDAVFQGAGISGNSETLRLGTLTKALTGAETTLLYVSNQGIQNNCIEYFTEDKTVRENEILLPSLSTEWTLAVLNTPDIDETAGVSVSQDGEYKGTLKTTLSGGATSVIIETESGQTILDSVDVRIGGATWDLHMAIDWDTTGTVLVHANIDSSTGNLDFRLPVGTAVVYTQNRGTGLSDILTDGNTYYVLAGTRGVSYEIKLAATRNGDEITIPIGSGNYHNTFRPVCVQQAAVFVTDQAIKINTVTIPETDIIEATQPFIAAPLYNVLQPTEWVTGITGWTAGNPYYIPMDVSFIESTFKNNEMPLFEIKDKQLKEMGPSQRIKLIDVLEGQHIMGADLDQLEDHGESTTPNGVPPTPTVPLGKKMKASLF